jgi:hypothetical protein
MIEIKAKYDQWVVIPNDKGEFMEPLFLGRKANWLCNYDSVKEKLKLETDYILTDFEFDIYLKLYDPKNQEKFSAELVTKIMENEKLIEPTFVDRIGKEVVNNILIVWDGITYVWDNTIGWLISKL